MLQRHCHELWVDSHLEISRLLQEELPDEPPPPEKDPVVFFQHLATLYMRYIQVFRQLDQVYDQMVHPQKRCVVRVVLDAVMGRVLELKNEMVEKDFSEYHNMTDVFLDLKLTPADLEIPIPRYFISELKKELKQRKAIVAEILNKAEDTENPDMMDRNDQGSDPAEITAQANKAKMWMRQEEYDNDYQKAVVAITKKVWEEDSQNMRNTLKEQIRQWFSECQDAIGLFPDYPDEAAGGSAIIFAQTDPQQFIDVMTAKKEEDSSNDPTAKEEKKETGKKKEKDNEEEEEAGLKMLPSAFLSDLELGHKTFVDFWQNRDESKNLMQRHELELIKEEQRRVIEAEIRVQVDEEMKQELAKLKAAVDKDKGAKTKGTAKKKKSGKAGKKKKKEKEQPSDRDIESLCQELVDQGLLKKAKNVRMQDCLGAFNYLGTTLRKTDIVPMLSLPDMRQLLSLYAILPLGSQVVREKAPLVKSILLAGAAGVGKKMLVHAICQETGANLFDLSPLITPGKYSDKNELTMMNRKVFKAAGLLQPSLIWIEDIDKALLKKAPKGEKESNIKLSKTDLLKCLKLIKAEDRVLIVGTTKDPQNADIKSLCKMCSKIILIPRPDYRSRLILWNQLIRKHGGEITSELHLRALATITDGYTPGHMVQVIQSVLTEQRLSEQTDRPLTVAEFFPSLAKFDRVLKDEEALKKWYAKTPLALKRAKAATRKEEEPTTKGNVENKKPKK